MAEGWRSFSKIYSHRHTLWNMSLSQLKAKYSGSILGISWAAINPLLIMLVITFVFTVVFKTEINNFPLFALAGIFPWIFLSNALSEAAASFLNQRSILRQFNLPPEIIPLSSVLSNFLNFLIGWFIIYPLFLFFNPGIISLLPVLTAVLLLNLFFVLGLGLILSIANIFIRDIAQLLNVLLMLWFWLTPVFYSADMVPARFRWVCSLNPMTPYIVYYRKVVFSGSMPSFSVFMAVFICAAVSLSLGLWVFARYEYKLLKQI